MLKMNYLAVIVAAVAAFVASSVWYAVFGKALAKVSPVFAELQAQKPAAWRLLAGSGGVSSSPLWSRMLSASGRTLPGWAQ